MSQDVSLTGAFYVGNGWVAGGCWDDEITCEMDHSRKFPAFSTSKLKSSHDSGRSATFAPLRGIRIRVHGLRPPRSRARPRGNRPGAANLKGFPWEEEKSWNIAVRNPTVFWKTWNRYSMILITLKFEIPWLVGSVFCVPGVWGSSRPFAALCFHVHRRVIHRYTPQASDALKLATPTITLGMYINPTKWH